MNIGLINEFVGASRRNDVGALERLVAQYPTIINALDRHGNNALSGAGGRAAIELLLANGAVGPSVAR
jgi:hypothetical protein